MDGAADEPAGGVPPQGLAADGHNELPRQEHRTPFAIVLDVLREPMFLLLPGGGANALVA